MPFPKILALDVGGTSVKSGMLEALHLATTILQTPIDSKARAEEILATFHRIFSHYLDEPFDAVSVGFPGPFDYENGICRILGVQKFESIFGYDMRKIFGGWLPTGRIPIFFFNDADAAIFGEAQLGAGKPYNRIIGLTLGTGCGSAFIAEGRLQKTGPGVPLLGEVYPILFQGEMADNIFSIRGLSKRFSEAGLPFSDIRQAAEAARAGNDLAKAAFEAFGADLGAFLQPLAEAFHAEAILLLGGISRAFDLFGAATSGRLSIPVLAGVLGEEAALVGLGWLAEGESKA